jgi:secreted PhoX family phosphatase
MKNIIAFALLLAFGSCNTKQISSELFTPVAVNYNNRTVEIPEGFSYKILFSEGDTVITNSGKRAPAKGSHDMIVYIPINNSSEHGYLYVNHEEHKPNAILGDGGGGTIFEVEKKNGEWQVVGDYRAIDFSNVGETFRNCGGTLTPHGTILTTEEEFPKANTEIYSRFGITDTTDYNGKKKFLNYGWMIEVDPATRKAIRKIKNFGRYPHEDAQCMADDKTIYFTSDNKPSILFKFIAQEKGNYDTGQLYAYQQSSDGNFGIWIELPMQEDSLLNIIDVAVRKHATMLISNEWIEAVGDKLYITESGSNQFDFINEVQMGGVPAKHLDELCSDGNNKYRDPFGRLLELDLKTNKLRVLLNGGVSSTDSFFCFSSPDAMTSVKIKDKIYLVISEDTHGHKNGKASQEVVSKNETYNEVFFLDLSIKNPSLQDLKRFMMAPEGCETTGNMFTPDGKTYFVTIQHPTTNNPAPFNKSCVLAITGF